MKITFKNIWLLFSPMIFLSVGIAIFGAGLYFIVKFPAGVVLIGAVFTVVYLLQRGLAAVEERGDK